MIIHVHVYVNCVLCGLSCVALHSARPPSDATVPAHMVQVVSAEPGKCVFEMKVAEEHLNLPGDSSRRLNGDLVDGLTTYALLSMEGGKPGVSVDLHVSYLKAAKPGETITIAAEVLKMGRTLAYTTAQIKNEQGDVIAQGLHTKHVGN
ncbi:PREDICTED: acyl-coenzyme A thioesterase 13-like isoform X2 [Branchiostoma belcheri]|uniref:Acyl-coenzyme A thioesterase 13 n=1 Tax=Branchiostoma belcheri TaxID=7741 RepID=A0A6P4YYM8_BRABE|nr:PREDICTED: acyl-coenzyme A thioesterase 13-like isoform X2 [Branchiostoma belcheri]